MTIQVGAVRESLTRCVACLDTVAIDPAQPPPLDDAPLEAASSSVTPNHSSEVPNPPAP